MDMMVRLFEVYKLRVFLIYDYSAGSMMSTYLTKFKIIEPQNSLYRWFAIHSSVGVRFQFSKWRKST